MWVRYWLRHYDLFSPKGRYSEPYWYLKFYTHNFSLIALCDGDWELRPHFDSSANKDHKNKFHNSSWSLFQVSIMAMEESRVLVWHRDKLKLSIMSDAFLQAVFDHILGRDVVHKLMQVLYKLYFLLSLPIFNIVLLYFRIKLNINILSFVFQFTLRQERNRPSFEIWFYFFIS